MCEVKNIKKAGPGRPREFKEADALSQIMSLFWEKGYDGTFLSDIVSACGVRKGSLYSLFGDKQQMYLKALSHYEALFVDTACEGLQGSKDPLAQITGFLNAPIIAAWDNHDRRGCFLCNASADHAALDSATEDMVQRGYSKMEHALIDAMTLLRPGDDIKKNTAKARLILTTYSGLRVMARSVTNRATLEDSKRAVLDYI